MDILSIENLYDPLFQPLCEINDDDLWVEKGIAYGRCSAFPFLMKTYEELLENVDNLSDVEKNNIISRFYSLIKQLSVDYLVFFLTRGGQILSLLLKRLIVNACTILCKSL